MGLRPIEESQWLERCPVDRAPIEEVPHIKRTRCSTLSSGGGERRGSWRGVRATSALVLSLQMFVLENDNNSWTNVSWTNVNPNAESAFGRHHSTLSGRLIGANLIFSMYVTRLLPIFRPRQAENALSE